MSDDRYEIRLAGSGGQGIVLASVILAEALTRNPANHVCQTQSYGPEARGGKCKAEIVVSRTPIDYPKLIAVDLLLAMNQASCDAFCHDLKPTGILLADATLVEQLPTSRAVALPFTGIARDRFRREIVANMIALGAVGKLCPLIDADVLETAIAQRSPAGTDALNREAFRAGVEAASAIDLQQLPRALSPGDPDADEV